MNNNDGGYNHYPGWEEDNSPGSNRNTPNKRQRTNNSDQVNPSDFLNFDYEFSLDPAVIHQQDPAPIPEDFFMFVTDNSEQRDNIKTTDSLSSSNDTTVNTPSPPIQELQPTQHQQAPQQVQNLGKINTSLAKRTSLPLQQQVAQHQLTTTNDPPNQAVHTIVVGGKPFRLSWESLKSDGPNNFFLEYFRKKKTKVMHIDRDPDIFELIVRHLRGYHIRSTDDIENQSLLFDATYYGLNRLKKLLQEYVYVNVGGRVFRLPWTLFQKGMPCFYIEYSHTTLYTQIIHPKHNKSAQTLPKRGLVDDDLALTNDYVI
jgi:hypothetical protein